MHNARQLNCSIVTVTGSLMHSVVVLLCVRAQQIEDVRHRFEFTPKPKWERCKNCSE